MTSLGIHVVDMFINLIGAVSGLRASSERISPSCAFDDHTVASLVFENGARGQLTTLTSTAMRWQVTVYGSNGWVELQGLDRLLIQPLEGERQDIHYPGFSYPAEATITAALDAFAEDIQGGAQFPISGDEITHGTRVLEAIIQSAESGEFIKI
jgi:predicted dehydrogenase